MPHRKGPAAPGRRGALVRLAGLGGLLFGGSGPVHSAPGPTVLVLGDSLSAEYGLRRDSGWVALLQARLAQRKLPHQVVNASISGETSSGGRQRLPALLARHRPAVVIIELGGNDALRGLALDATEDHLRAMARAVRAAGAKPLLLGMRIPPNYGRRYGEDFAALFPRVAREEQAALLPFFLASVAAPADLGRYFQADRIHPNEAAQPRMLDSVWPVLEPLLRGPAAAR